MKNKKEIIKFGLIFITTFILFECIELIIEKVFHINLYGLKYGWVGFAIFYGFKYHIFCCLFPALWAGYKCKHKKCKHDHCGN